MFGQDLGSIWSRKTLRYFQNELHHRVIHTSGNQRGLKRLINRREVEVKNENDISDTLRPAYLMIPGQGRKEALTVLKDAMYLVCKIHHIDFLEIVEKYVVD